MADVKQYPVGFFGTFEPVEVLYDFDGPRIFTLENQFGEMLFAYQNGEEADCCSYVVVPVDLETVDSLREGRKSVLDVLNQPWSWIIKTDLENNLQTAKRIPFSDIPSESLPLPGVMLLPELQPILTVRMVGEKLKQGNIPGSVIKKAVDGAANALKTLVAAIGQLEDGAERPEKALQKYYDLDAQRLAFASFEVSFRLPSLTRGSSDSGQLEIPNVLENVELKLQEEIGELLQKVLDWDMEEDLASLHEDEDVALAMLKAADYLSPPQRGIVKEVHVSGKLMGPRNTPKRLDREFSRSAKTRLTTVRTHKEKLVNYKGKIRAFDKDKLTFILREIEDVADKRCSVSDALSDEALSVFNEENLVAVVGRESNNLVEVLAINVVATDDEA